MRFSAHPAPVKKRVQGSRSRYASAEQNGGGRRGRAANKRPAAAQPKPCDKATLDKSAATIQRLFRGYLGRSWVLKLSHVVERVSKVVNIRDKFAPTRVRLQWLATHKDQLDWSDEQTKQLFQEEEQRLLTVLAQLEAGGHVHLAADGESLTDVDMVLQGNPEFYSDYFLFKRNQLAHSTLIRSVTWLFWHVASGATPDHDPDHLEFEAYRELFVRICKVLQPVFHLDTASAAALVDWQHDSQQFYLDLHGQTVMTSDAFHRSLFELVDTWTNIVDEEAYFNWLIALLWAVTENSTVHNDHYDLQLRPLDDVRECLDIDGTLHVPPRFWDQRDHLVDIALGIQDRREFPGHVVECFDVPAVNGSDSPDPEEQPEGHEQLMRMLYERRALRHLQLIRRLKFKAAIVGHFTSSIEARSARGVQAPSVPNTESTGLTAKGSSDLSIQQSSDSAEVAEALRLAEQESALAAAMHRRQHTDHAKTVFALRQGGEMALGQAMFGEGLASSHSRPGNGLQVSRRRTLVLKRAQILAELQREPVSKSVRPMPAEVSCDDLAHPGPGSETVGHRTERSHANRGSTAPTVMDVSRRPLFSHAVAIAQARQQLVTQAKQRRTEDQPRKRSNKPRRVVPLWPQGTPEAQNLPTEHSSGPREWVPIDVKRCGVFENRSHVAATAGTEDDSTSESTHRTSSPLSSASNAQVCENRVLPARHTHSTNAASVASAGASNPEDMQRDASALSPKPTKSDLTPTGTDTLPVERIPSDRLSNTSAIKGNPVPGSSTLRPLRDPQSPELTAKPHGACRRSPLRPEAEPRSASPTGSTRGKFRSPLAANSDTADFVGKHSLAALQYAAAPLAHMGIGTATLAPPRYKAQGANDLRRSPRFGIKPEVYEGDVDSPAEPKLRPSQPRSSRARQSSNTTLGNRNANFDACLPVNTALSSAKPRTAPVDTRASVADAVIPSDVRPSLQLEVTSNKHNVGSATDTGSMSSIHAPSPTRVNNGEKQQVQQQRARAGRLLVAATDVGLPASTNVGSEAQSMKQPTRPLSSVGVPRMHSHEHCETRQTESNLQPKPLPLGAMPSASPAPLKGSRNLRSQNFNASVLEHRRSLEKAQVEFLPAIPSRHDTVHLAVGSNDAQRLRHAQSQKSRKQHGLRKPNRKTGSILPPLPPSQVHAAAKSGHEDVLHKLEALVDGSQSAPPLPKFLSEPALPEQQYSTQFVFADNIESSDLPSLLGGRQAPESCQKKSLSRIASANNGRAMFGSAVASSSMPTNRRLRRNPRKQIKRSKIHKHRPSAALKGRPTTVSNAVLPTIYVQASAL
eukprot:INCI974.1.p1 GENE.INCI974.1~~INCI974.1.p1  ORF type:complete len:1313 (+),score=196.55 INCI974.1:283-4221(+)